MLELAQQISVEDSVAWRSCTPAFSSPQGKGRRSVPCSACSALIRHNPWPPEWPHELANIVSYWLDIDTSYEVHTLPTQPASVKICFLFFSLFSMANFASPSVSYSIGLTANMLQSHVRPGLIWNSDIHNRSRHSYMPLQVDKQCEGSCSWDAAKQYTCKPLDSGPQAAKSLTAISSSRHAKEAQVPPATVAPKQLWIHPIQSKTPPCRLRICRLESFSSAECLQSCSLHGLLRFTDSSRSQTRRWCFPSWMRGVVWVSSRGAKRPPAVLMGAVWYACTCLP